MDVRVDAGEVRITMDLRDLEDVVMDLQWVAENGFIEPRSQDLLDLLYEKGIK